MVERQLVNGTNRGNKYDKLRQMCIMQKSIGNISFSTHQIIRNCSISFDYLFAKEQKNWLQLGNCRPFWFHSVSLVFFSFCKKNFWQILIFLLNNKKNLFYSIYNLKLWSFYYQNSETHKKKLSNYEYNTKNKFFSFSCSRTWKFICFFFFGFF